MQATATLPLTINDGNTTVIGPGPYLFEELHVHEGHTLILAPGAELIKPGEGIGGTGAGTVGSAIASSYGANSSM